MEKVKEVTEVKEECCPIFHPEKWDGKTFTWNRKKFIEASVPTLFHIPLPPMIGNKVTKMVKMAEDSKKLSDDKGNILLLFRDPSAFQSKMYLSVTDSVPGAKNIEISGTFWTKVFDGPFKEVPKFMKKMQGDLTNQGKKAKGFYVHYGYCPKCAKEAGHNYMVLFAEIDG